MTPITILDNEYITLQYLPEKKIVYHTVHKPIDIESFAKAMAAGAEMLTENGACKWLSDDRKNGPLTPDMIAGPKFWAPRMIAAGWRYWANVVPEEIVSAGTLLPVMGTLYEMGLRMMVFTTVEEAFKWLDTMAEPKPTP